MTLSLLSLSDVDHIAHLARLELADGEGARTLARLNDFFKCVAQMQRVDTAGIAPLAHPIEDLTLRLRDDALTEMPQRDDHQRLAPATQKGLYLVPKVIE